MLSFWWSYTNVFHVFPLLDYCCQLHFPNTLRVSNTPKVLKSSSLRFRVVREYLLQTTLTELGISISIFQKKEGLTMFFILHYNIVYGFRYVDIFEYIAFSSIVSNTQKNISEIVVKILIVRIAVIFYFNSADKNLGWFTSSTRCGS